MTLFRKLVIASHNEGKVREIGELLAPLGVSVVSAGELGLEEPIEDGDSFIANARIKSLAAAKASNLPALADDSGLAVDALDGAPGIYSARWGGPEKDFNKAMMRIEAELRDRGVEPTGASAHFVCVLSLCWPDGREEHFEGKVFGTLCFPPRGLHGFGYDPIFRATGDSRSFAELDAQEKHAISHRADAFAKMLTWMKQKESA